MLECKLGLYVNYLFFVIYFTADRRMY